MNNSMKVRDQYVTSFFSRLLIIVALGLAATLAVNSVHAASATWNGTTDATWANTNNWSASPAPGIGDTATFSNAGNNNTNIDLASGVTTSNIVFDTSSAAAYTIGAGGAGSQTLTSQVNGAITVNSTVTKPQLVNANVSLGMDAVAGNYSFANNSGQLLTIAGIISGASGGTAGAKNLFVGGSGSMTISGNIANGGATSLALTKVGAGILTLSGNDSNTGSIIVSNGTVNLTGSYSTGGGAGNIGAGAPNGTAPIGVINILPGSTVTINGGGQNLFVGNYQNSLGVVNQSGGAITIGQNLKMGSDTQSTGTNYGFYNMTGGSMTMNNFNRWRVGQAQGSGGSAGSAFLFYLSGSGMITLNVLSIALNDNANAGISPANHAVLYVSGGSIVGGVPGGSGANGVSMGIGGKGGLSTNVVTISGTGSVSLNGTTGLGSTAGGGTSGSNANRVGILNLNGGGFLQTAQLFLSSSQTPVGYLNFNGGTLKAQTNNASFLAGLTQATVYSGGLTIDDNGAAITIGQALLAPTGSGVVSIAVSGATGYTGAPYVQIAGGNPTTPATAVANWDGSGTISTITITDPGSGYTSVPTVTLVGGGGTAGTLTPTLGTSGSGGLTKNGAGTLTLSGANTYTGLTAVASGALMLRGGSLGGSVTVGSGLTLGGDGTINGSVTLASGATSLQLSNGVGGALTVGNGLTLANGNSLSFELGSVGSSDKIALTGSNVTVNGTVTINLSSIGGFNAGNYNLITGGSLASTNGFVLGATPNPTFTYALTNSSGNLLVKVSTTNAALTAFWRGDVNGNWNTTSPNFNWATDSAGTNHTAFLPSLPTDVTFATTNAANFATTLGADFEISTLTFTTASNVTVAGANTLTIDNGLVVNSGAGAVTISSTAVGLGFSQVWSNNSANSFTASSSISGSGVSLTIAGTGKTVLAGTSTYDGGTTVNGGTLTLGNPTDTLANGGAVTINAATLDVSSNSDTVGAVTLVSGTITGTVGVLSSSAAEVQSGAVKAILGGSGGLTKTTSGTVTLSATNTYTGNTLVRAGTLVLDTGGLINNTVFSSVGRSGTDNGTLTLQGNASYNIVGADFNVGDSGGSKGTLYVSNNATVVASRIFVGSAFDAGSAAQGVVNQVSGTVTVTGAGEPVFCLGGSQNLTGNNGSGTYNLSGGTVLVANSGGNAWIGGWGQGALNVTGGGITFSNFLSVGRQRSPTLVQPVPVGTLTVSGGSVTQANPLAHTVIGELGTGTLVVASSGLMVVQGNDGLVVGNGPEGYGTVNLNGGTLITTNVNRNLGGTNGTAFFNFNGGTLKAKGTHRAFMTGLTTATVQSAGAVIDDSGFSITIGQPLLDGGTGGGLTKSGSGTLTLTGANTYQGPTAVNAGRLIIPASQTGTGAITVADGAALRVVGANAIPLQPTSITLGSSTGGTIEFDAVSNTTVAPVKVGTYRLNGTDPLKVVGGSFVLSNSYPLINYTTLAGTGTNTFKPPGGMTASLFTSNSTVYLNVLNIGVQLWKGNVNTNWDVEATANWTVNSISTTYGDGGPVQFDDTATTSNVTVVTDVQPFGMTVSNTTTYTFSGPGAIGGAGGLTKLLSGLMVLGGQNAYSGDTMISNGTLRLTSNGAIPSGTGRGSVILVGTLDMAGKTNSINGLSGTGTVNSSVAGTPVLTVGIDGSSSIFSGVVQNTAGTLALVKTGAGTFTLTGSNTYSGGTTLSGGQLNIGNASALGAASGTFTINAGTTIDNTSGADLILSNNYPLVWNGDFTYAGSSNNLDLGNAAVAPTGSVQITVTTNTLTVRGVISGSGSLTKAGGGTLRLLADNNFPGDMSIANGTLAVLTIGDVTAPGGVGAGVRINFGSSGPNNGTLLYLGTGAGTEGTPPGTYKQIYLSSSGGSGIIDMSGSGMLIFGADIQVSGAAAHTLTFQGSGPGTGEVDGVISDNSPANRTSIAKGGTGVWVLSGPNTYTGDTSIKTGTLVVASIGDAGATGNNLGGGTNIILGSIGATGTLVYVGGGEPTSKRIGLTASGTGGGIIDQSGSGLLKFTGNLYGEQAFDKSITLRGSATGSGEFAGAITEFGTNHYSVIKSGTGLWTLSGSNTYSGVTTINGGTLAISVNGVITNSPRITVAAGATLDVSGHTGGGMTIVSNQTLAGSGTVTGAVTIANGATLSPGASVGTLTVNGNLVLNDSSKLAYELGTNSDQTVVNGNLTLDGVLNVTDSGGFTATNYTLFTYTGTLVNNTLTVNPLPGGRTGTVVAASGTVVLQVGGGAPPTADFTANPTVGVAPLQVVFTDTSTGSPTSWAWDFDNNGTTDSTVENPTNTYAAGTYTVRLIACDGSGCSTNTKVNYITVITPMQSWANQYGVTADASDSDGDGMSNTNEFLAGFNPTNSAAYLRIISIVKSNNDIKVTYLGANGDSSYAGGPASRTNVLEFTSGTANGSYTNNFVSTGMTNILSGGTGVGAITNMVDLGGATNVPARYYRVRVLVP
ncbi:MAG: autotransporter-associated beta strand repeat-containing protein [Verrucomicrobiia bacterium]